MDVSAAGPSSIRPEPVVEKLAPDTCLALLATQTVGRLAVARPGQAPHIVPVNYALLGESIVFRTAPGTKLEWLITEPVSFEVDAFDPETRTGWSVVVHGLAYEASDREMEYENVELDSFVDRQNSRWACLQPNTITGRRIVRASIPRQSAGAAPVPAWVRNFPFFPRLEGVLNPPRD